MPPFTGDASQSRPFAALRRAARQVQLLSMKLFPLLVAGALLALAACARESGEVIRFATWGGASEETDFSRTINNLYRQFESKHPGVRLREEKIPGSKEYVSKMLLSFVAGTEPETMQLDASSAAIFIENGVLLDLRPFIERDPDFNIEDFYPNVVDIARRDEAIYAIPRDFTPMVMYYNKRLFDEAGVPYPADHWTYDEFLETAKKLTDHKRGRWGFKFDNWMPGWITWIWNNGGDVLSPDGTHASGFMDSPATVEAVQFMVDLVNKHRVAPSISDTAALGVNPFMNGDAAMQVAGHWALVEIQNAPKVRLEDIGIAPLPTNLPQSVTVMYQVGVSIGRNCRNPDLAWEFIKFHTSTPYQERYNASGIAISARRELAKEMAEGDPRRSKFVEIVPSARVPWGSLVEGYDYVETEGPKMMDAALAGRDPAAALREAARRIDAYFKIR
jgi:multiple sugar transport system substrate-binding protein